MSSDDEETFRLGRTLVITAIGSLLTLIVLLILLHLYAKYVLRRQERSLQNRRGGRASASRYSPTTELEPPVDEVNLNETHKTGLDHSTIALLPIFKYKPTDRFDHGEAIECPVCLSAIVEETMVRVLPNCNHMFHAECVDMWLGSHTTCPICRTTAEPRVQPTAPPLVESGLDGGAAPSEKVGGSGSRLSSFRRMMGRERSSSRIQSCEEVGAEDLERQ